MCFFIPVIFSSFSENGQRSNGALHKLPAKKFEENDGYLLSMQLD